MDKLPVPKLTLTARDYWRVGPVYAWKWLAVFGLALLSILILSIFGLPVGLFSPLGRNPPSYRYDDPGLAQLSGTVRVLDSRNVVRYQGEVTQGAYTGRGKVYSESGQLAYDGPLVDGVYEGRDAKVYQNGILVYTGEMAGNRYEGQGRRVDPDSGIISEGQFAAGKLEGEGREFYPDGTALRTGAFSDDLLSGMGAEYGRDGTLLREGTFAGGLLHGSGVQYTSGGMARYEGEFRRGVWHGQGRLYDTLQGALIYEGEFVNGQAVGLGRVYHPSGQLLYKGTVFDCRPRADAFLGLSLADVEAAFTEHWLLYSCDKVTAFVYPYFQLMFVTESPLRLLSPALQDARTERERRELLQALAQREADEGQTPDDTPDIAGDVPAREAETDVILASDTVKTDVVICQVLSYGRPLPGTAQPRTDCPSGRQAIGWREWFSDCASGERPQGAAAARTGQFVYEFTAPPGAADKTVDYYLAVSGGVEVKTVLKGEKDGALWYQSAVREDMS